MNLSDGSFGTQPLGHSAARCVVVVPTYNHAPALSGVLDGLGRLGVPIIVVDDGSSDETSAVIDHWFELHPEASLTQVRHARNRGKADALRSGFAAAETMAGVTHAVTIDSDGQLDPTDIPALVERAAESPQALILGVRPSRMVNCPRRCEIGRRFASLAAFAQTGRRFSDTQCGLRAYPLSLTREGRARAGRYSFEAEIITRAVWMGLDVIEVPVRCTYSVEGTPKRISHFRPIGDSLRQLMVHARLVFLALLPWTRSSPRPKRIAGLRGAVLSLGNWLNPARCIRAVRDSQLGTLELATALAFGVWIGTLPFFGLHGAICLYVAWKLNLHPTATVLGSQVSIPPVGFALAAGSIWLGHLLLTGEMIRVGELEFSWRELPRLAMEWLPAWTVGGVLLGFGLAVITFFMTVVITSLFRGSLGKRL